jgi:hypothetical protein
LAKENNDLLVRYLLGDLSEAERERVEEEYFVNQEAWDALGAAENDLIDSYVCGGLPPNRREQFEKHFLASPRKRKRVEFAFTLMSPTVRETMAEPAGALWKPEGLFLPAWQRALRLASVMAGLAMAAVVIWLAVQNLRLREDIGKMRSQQAELQLQIQTLQRQTARGKETGNGSGTGTAELPLAQLPTVSLLMAPGLLRNNGSSPQGHVLPVPAIPSSVVLVLYLERDEYLGYDVVLRTAEGKQVRHVEGLNSQPVQQGGKAVAVNLPSQILRNGDYVVTLSGKNAQGKEQVVDSYSFTVVR